MTRILALTTPPMRGADVTRLQRLLDNGKFGDFLHKSSIDGEYGPYTAQAVWRAKYWLGYAKPDHRAGAKLIAYLGGRTPLSAAMRARRLWRLRNRVNRAIRLKALSEMQKMVGMREIPPSSNRCPVTSWYGLVGPWCAMGVSYAYVKAGSVAFAKGKRHAACFAIIADARAGRNGFSLTRHPLPGDLVLMRWPGSKWEADHVGMVERADAGALITIEANTSPGVSGSQDNGGGCYRRNRTVERSSGIVVLYVHISK